MLELRLERHDVIVQLLLELRPEPAHHALAAVRVKSEEADRRSRSLWNDSEDDPKTIETVTYPDVNTRTSNLIATETSFIHTR